MWEKQNRKKGASILALTLSVALHVLVVVALYFAVLRVPHKTMPPEIEVLAVQEVEQPLERPTSQPVERGASSAEQPKVKKNPPKTMVEKKANAPVEKPKVAPPKEASSPVNTQKDESALKAAREAEEEARRLAEENRKREEAKKSVLGAFGKSKQKQSGGEQASSEAASASGSGKIGSGSGSFSLSGRNIVGGGGVPIRPETKKAVRGRVVVGILVNPQGRVVDAWIEPQGTQIADPEVRAAAIRAAKKTAFSSSKTADDQKGNITYLFDIR